MKRASEKSSQADCKSCRAKKAKCENFFSNEDEHDYVKFCKGGVAKEISANISDQECELFFFFFITTIYLNLRFQIDLKWPPGYLI